MKRLSGKTQSTCYVEFGTYSDAQRMVQRRNNRALGTRNVQLSIVPQEELMEAVFPRFRGEWRGVDPWIREVEEGMGGVTAAAETGEYMSRDGIVTGGFVSREEINSILTHAKTYRVRSRFRNLFIHVICRMWLLTGSLHTVGSVLNVRMRA